MAGGLSGLQVRRDKVENKIVCQGILYYRVASKEQLNCGEAIKKYWDTIESDKKMAKLELLF